MTAPQESDDRPGAAFAALLRKHLDVRADPISYLDLAKRTGLTKGYISMLMKGRRRPRPAAAERIGRAIGLKSRDIAEMISAASPELRTSSGPSAGFWGSASEPSSNEALISIQPIIIGKARTPMVQVYAADRRGVVLLQASTMGPSPGYLSVSATNGPDFGWIRVTPDEPLQQLPIHADSAILRLGIEDEEGKPRQVHEIELGPRQFLGL
jgi:transcriptional regulator with XRE-family HTH domain